MERLVKDIQGELSTSGSPLLSKLSGPKWDIYDTLTLLGLGAFLISYFLFHGLYVDYIWGDFGRWHEEVKRFTQGEIPYKDFTWPYPPLSLYLYGWLAKVFGNSFLALRLISTGITILISFLVFSIARHCVPKKILPIMVIACVMMGAGNSSHGGETLGAGMYTPAAPVGILMSLLCLFAAIRYIASSSKSWLYVMGIGFAGAFLSKQDFWPPVLACAIILCIYQWQSRSSIADFGKQAIRWLLPALTISAGGCLLVIMHAGLPAFIAGMSGFGIARGLIGRLYPTWRRIFDSFFFLFAFAILGLAFMRWDRIISRRKAFLLLIITCVAALVFGGVRVIMTFRVGSLVASGDTEIIYTRTGAYFSGRTANTQQVLLLTVKHLVVTAIANAIPLFVAISSAIAFLWVFWKYRGSPMIKVGLLLAVWAILARTRRLFEMVDVIHLLVEPLFFALAMQIACIYKGVNAKSCHRLILRFAIVFFAIGLSLLTFYELQPRVRSTYQEVTTEMGSIKLPSDQAAEFRILESLITSGDPSASRPLVAGPSYRRAALNYMLNRRNPAHTTLGVKLQEVLETVAEQRPIIILDSPLIANTSIEAGKKPTRVNVPAREFLDLSVWEPKLVKTRGTSSMRSSDEQHTRESIYKYLVSLGYRRVETPIINEIYFPP